MKLFPSFILAAALTLPAMAAEPKKVIVCTVTTGFRHSSIGEAEKTLQKLADESKAYTVVDWVRQPQTQVPKAPSKPKELKPEADDKAKAKHAEEMAKYEAAMKEWESEGKTKADAAKKAFDEELKAQMAKLSPANLKAQKIDGVIFANTTGDDFPLPDKDGFIQWIADGGAFMGMHSATDTFKTWQPYYEMLQGTFNGHGPQVPADLIVADSAHPATAGLPSPWNLKQEEMYVIKNHDRAKLRTLLFLNHEPVKTEQKGYYPVAWCREHGKGRVFYTSLGHREDLWSDDPALKGRINPVETSKQYQQHILGGMKWALGLAAGSAAVNNPLP
jgi:type 1 glutamine amidotransferase